MNLRPWFASLPPTWTAQNIDGRPTAGPIDQNRLSMLDMAAWREYAAGVRRATEALYAHGIRPGDRVGIMMVNRPEFHIIDTGALHARAVPVSIYNSLPPEQIAWILKDAGVEVVITEARFVPVLLAAREHGWRTGGRLDRSTRPVIAGQLLVMTAELPGVLVGREPRRVPVACGDPVEAADAVRHAIPGHVIRNLLQSSISRPAALECTQNGRTRPRPNAGIRNPRVPAALARSTFSPRSFSIRTTTSRGSVRSVLRRAGTVEQIRLAELS
ncbi:AMP-binding protein [Rhodococcus ruber]|uniref:AMP-binding protein n=1 Tax=Rhodococcus ruber TaxID=1830 RepID=UPI001F2D89EF|nr:AMP-binding protein [Rhodococcus ruber]